jgi:PadR family transcriptional regulator PadR
MPPHESATDVALLRGTFHLLILKTLAWGPMHGLGVLRWLEGASGNRLSIEEGALYPALHRMEERGWLASEWRISEQNRKAKFYRLTPAGRKQLGVERARWSEYASVVETVLAAEMHA